MRLAPPLLLVSTLGACDGAAPPTTNPPADTAAPEACFAWSYDGAPVVWALPTGVPAGTFAHIDRGADDCSSETTEERLPSTRLVDLTGDGRRDLVALSSCEDAGVGRDTWRVWPGVDGGFGAELAWALPADYDTGAFSALRDTAVCGGLLLPAFRLDDLDGDGRPDLVVTDACVEAEAAWRMYPNTGEGFAAEEPRVLPEGYSTGAFETPRAAEACDGDTNVPAWAGEDLDGDGATDLVVTDNCRSPTIGTDQWEVYASAGGLFPTTPIAWTLPPEVRANALARDIGACAVGLPDYFLLDVLGDGLPDLVVPRPCVATGSAWTVYANEGDGFSRIGALQPAPWGLSFAVDRPRRIEPDCALGLLAWEFDDMDGDRDADLTFTAGCTDAAVGDTRWDVHVGSAVGWAPAAPIALPTGYSAQSFRGGRSPEAVCGGSADRPAWEREDLDGDGVPELIVTEACDDAAVGTEAWRVYRLECAED